MQTPESLPHADRKGYFIEIDPIRLHFPLSGNGNHEPLGKDESGLPPPPSASAMGAALPFGPSAKDLVNDPSPRENRTTCSDAVECAVFSF
jgi:hypothetical protein